VIERTAFVNQKFYGALDHLYVKSNSVSKNESSFLLLSATGATVFIWTSAEAKESQSLIRLRYFRSRRELLSH
jgi:hypothetical protein